MVPCGETHTHSTSQQLIHVVEEDRGGECWACCNTYSKIFQVDHDGEGHPQVFISRHHTSSQRNDALKDQNIRQSGCNLTGFIQNVQDVEDEGDDVRVQPWGEC